MGKKKKVTSTSDLLSFALGTPTKSGGKQYTHTIKMTRIPDPYVALSPDGSQTDPKHCLRYDGGKEPMHLIPIRPLFELARVYRFGSLKYDDDNWRKGTKYRRCIGSMLRHVYKFAAGETIDPESQVHHMAHAAFWAFALIDWTTTHPECDDRLQEMA